MSRYKIGVSADFMRPDGAPAFPDWDMAPLDEDERIDWTFVPVKGGVIAAEDMADCDALILLSARFNRESLPANGRLGIVARFGVGFDNVDVEACTGASVAVVITPDGVRRPVAVAIVTQLLALAGRLFDKDRLVRQGPEGWPAKAQFMGIGLEGRTLGSIGLGNIACEMFRLASVFGLSFIACDPYADRAGAAELGVDLVDMDTVFRDSDFLTVNCPLSDETQGLVNGERIALMKATSFLLNTARGPIVDQRALASALRDKTIAGAALDVFESEPLPADDPLIALDNVILTPHALSWTDQCFAGIGAADVKAVIDVMEGHDPVGVINPSVLATEKWKRRLAHNAQRSASRKS